jgi:hypothetical protein
LVEPLHVIGVVEEVAMRRGLRRLVVVATVEGRDAGEPMADVEGIRNLALLTITDTIDPGRSLLSDDLSDRVGETCLERTLIELAAGLACLQKGQQIGRTRQAADMGRQNAVGA